MRIFFVHHEGHEIDNKEMLIYVHVPKTAGQTLGEIIEQQYPINETQKVKNPKTVQSVLSEISKGKVTRIGCYVEHLESYLQNAPEAEAAIKSIYGHMHFGIHRYLSKPYAYITMLREPVDRVISHYYYFLGKGHFKQETTIEQFIATPRLYNLQTRFISGDRNPDLNKAKENIDKHFSVVGIMEMFHESLFLMKKCLGWENVNYAKKNVTANRPTKEQVSKKIMDQIMQRNELDMELYRYAKASLDRKLQDMDDVTKQEMKRFVDRLQNHK